MFALVDELWSGIAVTGAPSVERELSLTHGGYAVFVFALPLVVTAVLEACLALLSDRWPRRWFVAGGQVALIASLLVVALTPSAWGLTAGLAVAGAASGIACGAAQVMLIARDGDGARAMTRWTTFAAAGDVLAPIVTACALAFGSSYRGAMLAVAALVAVQFVLTRGGARSSGNVAHADANANVDVDAEESSLRAALGDAWKRPRLFTWLAIAAACTLLDEIVVALAALRIEREEHASATLATASAVVFALGGTIGSALTERAIARVHPSRILAASGVACAAALAIFLAMPTAIASCAALFVVGLACAPHHALAQARAYAELPERPGVVQAIGQLFVIVDIAAPLALGALADRFGLRIAIACLLIEPAIIIASSFIATRGNERKCV
jgi:MFS family permease